jgi:hypothetical protein
MIINGNKVLNRYAMSWYDDTEDREEPDIFDLADEAYENPHNNPITDADMQKAAAEFLAAIDSICRDYLQHQKKLTP